MALDTRMLPHREFSDEEIKAMEKLAAEHAAHGAKDRTLVVADSDGNVHHYTNSMMTDEQVKDYSERCWKYGKQIVFEAPYGAQILPEEWTVKNGALVKKDRITPTIQLNGRTVTISGLPIPTSVGLQYGEISVGGWNVDDGELEVTLDLAGEYVFGYSNKHSIIDAQKVEVL